jgi:hypothetical protein
VVRRRRSEHLRDHGERQREGQGVDEIYPAFSLSRVEQAVDQAGNPRPQCLHRPRREGLRYQPTQPGVIRRVAVEHGHTAGTRGPLAVHLLAQLQERDRGNVTVLDRQVRPEQPGDIVIAAEQPEPEGVLVDGRRGAQRRVLRVGVVGETGRERVEQRRRQGLGHGSAPSWPPARHHLR